MSHAVKVGIFMTLALVLLGWFVLQIEDLTLFGPEGDRVEAVFPTVAGLDDKSAVRVAGVRVGRVDGIGLEDGRAVVRLLLETPVELREGARAEIASMGLLGDKYVRLEPGLPEAPPLPDGARLPGRVPPTFDEAMERLNEVAVGINELTRSVSGAGGENNISRLIDNLEATSELIRMMVTANRDQVDATVANFERLSGSLADEVPGLADRLDGLLAEVEVVVSENRGNLQGSLENIRQLTAGLQSSVDDLSRVSTRIADGEGSLGKLVASDEAHDQLVATLASVESGVEELGDAFAKVRALELELGFEGYYLEDVGDSRTAFSIELDPPTDRFYLLEAIDDPRGRRRRTTETITVTEADGTSETTTIETLKIEDKVTFTAQFGLEVGDARLRGGLIESTGGAGLDYRFLDQRLGLTVEAFDFGRGEDEEELDPRVRLFGRWNVTPNLYLLGGADDLLVSDRRSLFFGAGLRWRDDDLKYLLGSVPTTGF